MPTGLHATASATEHTDWQILVSVAVAVCDSAAVQNHAVVQQTSTSFRNVRKSRQQVTKQCHVIVVNLADLGLLVARATVVRNIMVSILNRKILVRTIAAGVGIHKRNNSC